MNQLLWFIFQAGIVLTFLYIDYTDPMDGQHKPGMMLIVGIIVAVGATVCITAAIDGIKKLIAALKRNTPHIR